MSVRADRRTVAIAIFIVAIMVFPVMLFTGNEESSQAVVATSRTTTITYVDPYGTNASISKEYYGIPATEYNPMYWDLDTKWVAPVKDGDNFEKAKLGSADVLVPFTVKYSDTYQEVSGDYLTINGVTQKSSDWIVEGKPDPSGAQYVEKVIKISMPTGVTVPGYTDQTDNWSLDIIPIANAIGDVPSTGKNETRFQYTGINGSATLFSLTYHYYNDCIYIRVNTCSTPANINDISDGNEVICSFNARLTLSGSEMSDLDVKHVFGGWILGESELVYPGDVVPLNTTQLKAKWVFPDILVTPGISTTSLSVTSKNPTLVKASGGWNADTTFTQDIIISDFTGTSSITGWFHEVDGVYVSGKSNDMFRTVYLLKPDNYDTDNTITATSTNVTVGTYRSYDDPDDDTYKKVTILLNGDLTMIADVTIDNVNWQQKKSTDNRIGQDVSKSKINANNYRLILGTGIETLQANSSVGNKYDTIYYTPVVYGGHRGNNIRVQENKSIVAANFGQNETLSVDIGTYMIIHSGTYGNVLGGGSIGSTSAYRSTYMVIKSAVVIGVVSGGTNTSAINGGPNNMNNNYLTGGSFIYAYDLKMLGDKFEDMAAGVQDPVINDAHTKWRIDESSALQGGNYSGRVNGCTHIFLSGTSSIFEVAAGGRNAKSVCNATYLEITGKAIVRHVACGTVIDGSENENNSVGNVYIRVADAAKVATLLGAGYDTYTLSAFPSKYGGTIDIDVTGGILGYIYGGGMRGTIGKTTATVTINLDISGGTVLKDVFGGGRGGLDKVHHKAEITNDEPTGQFGRFDKDDKSPNSQNATGFSQVVGNINVNISGGTIQGNVYGGGESTAAVETYYSNSKNWTSENFVRDHVSSVYGSTKVTVSGGTIQGNVYGAGKGIDFENGSLVLEMVDLNEVVVDGVHKYTYWNGKQIPYYATIILMKEDGTMTYIPWKDVPFEGSKAKVTFRATTDNLKQYEKFAAIHGTSEVVVNGGNILGDVYGGGAYGQVLQNENAGNSGGNTSVTIGGGTVGNDVFGGGVGHKGQMSVVGKRTIEMTGGTITGNLYGGSKVGYDGLSNYLTSNALVVIGGGTIQHSVFGGGLLGKTYGNTAVYLGYEIKNGSVMQKTVTVSTPSITVESVYAGGNVDSDVDAFTQSLVMGTGAVKVYGAKVTPYIHLTGSIMGSGNACNTYGETNVELRDFWNPEQMTGLHRITNLDIISSSLKITGRNPLTDIAGQMKPQISIYGVGTLTLQNEANLAIDFPMDVVEELVSLNKDGAFTTASSPSNRLVFTSGATIYIRSVTKLSEGNYDIAYGPVSGYTNIQVVNAANYGAYVLGSTSSVGGFTVSQSGAFREADISDSADARCWFISGIEKKTAVINLQAAPTEQVNRTVHEKTSIEFSKIQNDTSIIYVGGSFTPVSSDTGTTKTYSFVRPGQYEDSSELGLALAYYDSNSGNAVYDPTVRYMDVGNGMQNARGTFYSDDAYSSEEGGQKKLTSVIMNYSGGSTGQAGTYAINLCLSGIPVYKTSYVGYVILNFQEVISVSYETSGDQETNDLKTLIANKIEVRIDIYIYGSQSDTSYSVMMKTDTTEVDDKTYRSGTSSILVPSSFPMQPLRLQSIEALNQDNSHAYGTISGTMIVLARSNSDNTLGWASISQGSIWDFDHNELVGDSYIGTLLGNVLATVQYDLNDFRFVPQGGTEESIPYKLRMTFTRTPSGGAPIDNYVDILLVDKRMYDVRYWEHGVSTTISYVEGTPLNYENCKKPSGVNFNGWYLDPEYVNRYDYNMQIYKDGIELYARYSYVITFDNMNGTSSQMYVAEDPKGVIISKYDVPTPSNPGYDFNGWYKEKEMIEEWDYLSDRIVGNTTLYAKWVGKEVIVHFWYEDATNYNKMTLFGYSNGAIFKTTADSSGEHAGKFDLSNTYMLDKELGLYPVVSFGMTFDEIDPFHEISGHNLDYLAFAQSVIEQDHGFSGEFVRWEIKSPSDPNKRVSVYKDTLITRDILALVNEDDLDDGNYWKYYLTHNDGFERYWGGTEGEEPKQYMEINLIAVAAKVGIHVEMVSDSSTHSSSVTISPPSSFTVFPNTSSTDTSKRYTDDAFGTKTCEDVPGVVYRSVVVTFKDTGADPESFTYGLDRFGNLFIEDTEEGTYTFAEKTLIYKTIDGVEHRYAINWPNKVYEYNKTDDVFNQIDSLTGYYLKDTAGHEYTGVTRGSGPVPAVTPVPYYEFIYTLNDAARGGYELIGWHNVLIPDQSFVIGAGSVRVLNVSVEETDNKLHVTRAVIEDIYEKGLPRIMPLNIAGKTWYLNDLEHTMEMKYDTRWSPVQYHVSLTNVNDGEINAFCVRFVEVDHEFVEQRTYIDNWNMVFYYGDRIEISYSPKDVSKNHFGGWVVNGECSIDSTVNSSATIVIMGNSSIRASEYEDSIIDVMIKYDGGFLSDTDNRYTFVYLVNEKTGEEYSTNMVNKTMVGQLYRTKVPMFETYVVKIKYGVDRAGNSAPGFSGVPDVYTLLGDINVDIGSETTYLYTVISARFVGTQSLPTYKAFDNTPFDNPIPQSILPTGYHYEVDLSDHPIMILDGDGKPVVKLTKYVGIQERNLRIAEANNKHINNANTRNPPIFTPPVMATFEPGYYYEIYEGFPAEVNGVMEFLIATGVNLYGYDPNVTPPEDPHKDLRSTNNNTAWFYLNWVAFDKPADIMIKLGVQNIDKGITLGTVHETVVDGSLTMVNENKDVVIALDESYDGEYEVIARDGYAIDVWKKSGNTFVPLDSSDKTKISVSGNVVTFNFDSTPDIEPVVLYRLISTIRLSDSSSEYQHIDYGNRLTVEKRTVGEIISLPNAFNTDVTINSWQVTTTSGDTRTVTGTVGSWSYTVVVEDLGQTLLFTPYTDHGDVIYTFITSKGVFSNGEQSIKVYLHTGDSMETLLGNGGKLNWIRTFTTANYTFVKFTSGANYYIEPDGDYNIGGTTVSDSLTFTAEWTASTKTINYAVDDGGASEVTDVTVVKGSSNPGAEIESGDSVEYSADITITIQPGEGRELDIEKTRGHIGYALKEEYFYIYNDSEKTEYSYKCVDGVYYKYNPKTDSWEKQPSMHSKPAGSYYKSEAGDHIVDSTNGTGMNTVYRYENGSWVQYTAVDVLGQDGFFTKWYKNGSDEVVYKSTIDDVLYKKDNQGHFVEQSEFYGFCYLEDGMYHLFCSKYEYDMIQLEYYLTYDIRISSGDSDSVDVFGNTWRLSNNDVFTMLGGSVYAYDYLSNKVVSFEYNSDTKQYETDEPAVYSIGFDSNGRLLIKKGEVPLSTFFKDINGNHFTGSGFVNHLYDADGKEYEVKYMDLEYDYLYYNHVLTYLLDLDGNVYEKVAGEWTKIDDVSKSSMFYVDSNHTKHYAEFAGIMVNESLLEKSRTKVGSALVTVDGLGNIYDDWLGVPEELPNGRGYQWSFLMLEDLDLTIYSKPISYNIYFYVDKKLLPHTSEGMSVLYSNGVETHGHNVNKNSVVGFDKYYGVKWYTDASCTIPFTGMKHIHGSSGEFNAMYYQYLAKGNLTLYAHLQTYSVFVYGYDDDESYIKYDLTVVDGKVTLPTSSKGYSDHLFVGWAVIPDGDTKHTYTYAPGEEVSIRADYLNKGYVNIYEYYLLDASKVTYYDGVSHDLVISQDTALDKQALLGEQQLLVEYISGDSSALHVGDYSRDYNLFIDISGNSPIYGNTEIEYRTSGIIHIKILRGDGYVVAPSKSARLGTFEGS